MLERLFILIILLALGYVAYRIFTKHQLQKASASITTDAIFETAEIGIPTIVYFTTPNCVICKTTQQPALQRLKTQLGQGVQIIQIDAYEQPDAASRWGVMSAPTTFVLDKDLQPRVVNNGVVDEKLLTQQLKAISA